MEKPSNESAITSLIELFESVKQRPAKYFGRDDDVFSVHAYVAGVVTACSLVAGWDLASHYSWAVEARGWEFNAHWGPDRMRERGLSDREIVQALLSIEIDVLRAFRQSLEKEHRGDA